MTDEEALLAGVLMVPGGDLPRLVLADWLDEHGEGERAEFIRVQCELAEVTRGWKQSTVYPERYFDPERREYPAITPEIAALRKRERELLDEHWAKWVLDLKVNIFLFCKNLRLDADAAGRSCVEFRRGFVSSLTLSADDWLAHADALTWCWGACPTHQPDRIVDQTAGGSHTYRCPHCSDSGLGRVVPTGACEKCKGKKFTRGKQILGVPYGGAEYEEKPCKKCSGTGRVPRPCPATAQPIEHVHLTTGVDFGDVETWGVVIWRGPRYSTVFNSDRWPGITFHLPQMFDADWPSQLIYGEWPAENETPLQRGRRRGGTR